MNTMLYHLIQKFYFIKLWEKIVLIDEKDENDKSIINKFGEIEFDIGKDYDTKNRSTRIDMKQGGTYNLCSSRVLKKWKKIKTT